MVSARHAAKITTCYRTTLPLGICLWCVLSLIGCHNPATRDAKDASVPGELPSDGGAPAGSTPDVTGQISDTAPPSDAPVMMPDGMPAPMPTRRRVRPGAADEDAGCAPLATPVQFDYAVKCSLTVCPAQDSICLLEANVRLVSPQSTVDMLARCEEPGFVCVPTALAGQVGRAVLPSCTSLNGAEGRCVSSCIPLVASQASSLPKDVCTGSDLCAPCFDPRTGEDTLACRQGCDHGPVLPPKPFASCCSDRGLCVPPSVSGDDAADLAKDTCADDTLCAPRELTDLAFKPSACASLDGAEGRCISTCIGGGLAKRKALLPTAGCNPEEVCAPCFDPVTGEDTGACTVHGDAPTQPKQLFARCCGENVGVCVPSALAGDEAALLGRDSCAQGKLCAPIEKAKDPDYKFPACPDGSNGACVPACTLNQFIAPILPPGMCADGSVCSPCSLFSASTGACD